MPLEQPLKLFPSSTQQQHLQQYPSHPQQQYQPQRFEYSLPSANTVLSVPIEYPNHHINFITDNVTTNHTLCASSSSTSVNTTASGATITSHQPVTYLDRGQWYEVKVNPLYAPPPPAPSTRANPFCSTEQKEQIYFSLKIEFVDKQMEEIDMILWRRWLDLHPGERLVEIDASADCGIEKILYDSHEHNHVGLVVVQSGAGATEQMRFRVRFNCVSSQFPLLLLAHRNSSHKNNKAQSPNSSGDSSSNNLIHSPQMQLPVFRLVVESYSDVTGVKFDSVACLIKLFWSGMSAHQHQMDRYRLIRGGSAENLQHLSTYYHCAQTVLTKFSRHYPPPPSLSAAGISYHGEKSPTIEKLYPNIMKMLQQPLECPKLVAERKSAIYPKIPSPPEGDDQRKVLCILRGTSATAAGGSENGAVVNLIKGRHYQMSLKPLNLDRNQLYTTCVRLSLGSHRGARKEEASLMTNLTAMLGEPLIELDYSHSDLSDSVLDVQSASRHNLNLIWSGARLSPASGEVKFTFRLNCLSTDFCTCASQDNVDLYLLVETFAHRESSCSNSSTPIEQSYFQIKIEKQTQRNSSEPKSIGYNDLLQSTQRPLPQLAEFTVLKCGAIPKSTTEDRSSVTSSSVNNNKMTIYIFYLYLNEKNYTTMPFPLSFPLSGLTLERLRDKIFLPLVQKYVGNQSIRLEQLYYCDLQNAFCREASIPLRDDKCVQRVFKTKCGYKLELEPVATKSTAASSKSKASTFNFPPFQPLPSTSKAPNYIFHCPAPPLASEEVSYNLYISECFIMP